MLCPLPWPLQLLPLTLFRHFGYTLGSSLGFALGSAPGPLFFHFSLSSVPSFSSSSLAPTPPLSSHDSGRCAGPAQPAFFELPLAVFSLACTIKTSSTVPRNGHVLILIHVYREAFKYIGACLIQIHRTFEGERWKLRWLRCVTVRFQTRNKWLNCLSNRSTWT